jgi:hypothetical protein
MKLTLKGPPLMVSRWKNTKESALNDIFEGLHIGLTVDLIATPRNSLMTCMSDDILEHVVKRNTGSYDFLPVIDQETNGPERIKGLFHAAEFYEHPPENVTIEDHFHPISENYLIGANSSILDFVKTADEQPCRLMVSGGDIAGLVSLSDLQKLPVRAALFALITGFEMTMAAAIRTRFQQGPGWTTSLNARRQSDIKSKISASRREDSFVDELLFTQFADKATIIREQLEFSRSNKFMKNRLSAIGRLRDNLAHANEYAATSKDASKVCGIVRDLLDIRAEIASNKLS